MLRRRFAVSTYLVAAIAFVAVSSCSRPGEETSVTQPLMTTVAHGNSDPAIRTVPSVDFDRFDDILVASPGLDPDLVEIGPCAIALDSEKQGMVEVSFDIENVSDTALVYLANAQIYEADGSLAATLNFARELAPGDSSPELVRWNHLDFDPHSLSCEVVDLQLHES